MGECVLLDAEDTMIEPDQMEALIGNLDPEKFRLCGYLKPDESSSKVP